MILEVVHGNYGYRGEPEILQDIQLQIPAGRVLAVLGPNGVGKTTLLKCMTGLLHWRSGKTLLEGKDISELRPKQIWSVISYIPQARPLPFSYTGEEMVVMGRSVHLHTFEQPGETDLQLAKEMMERVGITHLAKKSCNRMSGGELQMILIAKAMISNPKLLVLDEPETGLDFHNQILVMNMIERLVREEHISAVMNTHYPTNAISIADDTLLMNYDGNYIYGATKEVLIQETIAEAFDVNVLVNESLYEEKIIKSVVPVSLRNRKF